MATLLDVGVFQYISVIFTFIFIFAVVYGLLSFLKPFKVGEGSNGLYALIALSISFLGLLSGGALQVIQNMTPWFTALIIFMFFVFFIVRMWTGDDDEVFKTMLLENTAIKWVLIVIFILIVIVGFSSTYGQSLLEQGSGEPGTTTVITGQEPPTSVQPVPTDPPSDAVQQPTGSGATGDFNQNVLATIINPQVLGLILMMLIGFFTILFLARTGTAD